MYNMELKNIIAENCYSFEPKLMGNSNSAQNCSNCRNYKRDCCAKGIYNKIKYIISNN